MGLLAQFPNPNPFVYCNPKTQHLSAASPLEDSIAHGEKAEIIDGVARRGSSNKQHWLQGQNLVSTYLCSTCSDCNFGHKTHSNDLARWDDHWRSSRKPRPQQHNSATTVHDWLLCLNTKLIEGVRAYTILHLQPSP